MFTVRKFIFIFALLLIGCEQVFLQDLSERDSVLITSVLLKNGIDAHFEKSSGRGNTYQVYVPSYEVSKATLLVGRKNLLRSHDIGKEDSWLGEKKKRVVSDLDKLYQFLAHYPGIESVSAELGSDNKSLVVLMTVAQDSAKIRTEVRDIVEGMFSYLTLDQLHINISVEPKLHRSHALKLWFLRINRDDKWQAMLLIALLGLLMICIGGFLGYYVRNLVLERGKMRSNGESRISSYMSGGMTIPKVED